MRDREKSTAALARTASAPSVLEHGLLRALRRRLHPGLDAGAEADLALSGLVAAAGGRFVRFRAEALGELRIRLRAEIAAEQDALGESPLMQAIRDTVVAHHAHAPAPVRLHDEIVLAWLQTGDADESGLRERLAQVVRAGWDADRPGVARWAGQLLRGLPGTLRSSEAGHAVRWMTGQPWEDSGAPAPDEGTFRRLFPHALRGLPRVPLGVRLGVGVLELADGVPDGFSAIDVPGTDPRFVEAVQGDVAARLTVPTGGRIAHEVAPGPVELRDGVGHRWEVAVDTQALAHGGVAWLAGVGKGLGLEEALEAHGWTVGAPERARLLVFVGSAGDRAPSPELREARERGLTVVSLLFPASGAGEVAEVPLDIDAPAAQVVAPHAVVIDPSDLLPGRCVAQWLRRLQRPELLDVRLLMRDLGDLRPRPRLLERLRRADTAAGRVALLGGAGTGKTALVLQYVQQVCSEGRALPILAILRRDGPWSGPRVEQSVRAQLSAVHGKPDLDLAASAALAASESASTPLVWVFDGWDELPPWAPDPLTEGVGAVFAGRAEPGPDWEVVDLHQERLAEGFASAVVGALDLPAQLKFDAIDDAGPSFGALLRLAAWLTAPAGAEPVGRPRPAEQPTWYDEDVPPGALRVLRQLVEWHGRVAGERALLPLWALTVAPEPLSRAQLQRVVDRIASDDDEGVHDAWPRLVAGLLDELPGDPPRYRVAWPHEARDSLPEALLPVLRQALADTVGRWPPAWGAPDAERSYAARHGAHPVSELAWLEARAELGLHDENRRLFAAAEGPLSDALRSWDAATGGAEPRTLASWVARRTRGDSAAVRPSYPDRPLLQVASEHASRSAHTERPIEGAHYCMGGSLYTWAARQVREIPLYGEITFRDLPAAVTAAADGVLGLADGSVWRCHRLGFQRLDDGSTAAITAVAADDEQVIWGDGRGRVSRPGAPAGLQIYVLAAPEDWESELFADLRRAGHAVHRWQGPVSSADLVIFVCTKETRRLYPKRPVGLTSATVALYPGSGRKAGQRPAWLATDKEPMHREALLEHIASLQPDTAAIRHVALREGHAAWSTADGEVWSAVQTGSPRVVFVSDAPVNDLLCLPGGQVATAHADGTVRLDGVLRPLRTATPARLLGHRDGVIAWTPDEVHVDTVVGSAEVRRLAVAPGGLRAVAAWTDSEPLVLTASAGGVDLWDLEGAHRGWLRGTTSAIGGLQVTSDSRLLAWCEDGSVFRWSLRDRTLLAVLGDPAPRWIDGSIQRGLVRSDVRHARYDGDNLHLFASSGAATFSAGRGLAQATWDDGRGRVEWRGSNHRPTTAVGFDPVGAHDARWIARGDDEGVVHVHVLASRGAAHPVCQAIALAGDAIRAVCWHDDALYVSGDGGEVVALEIRTSPEGNPERLVQRGPAWLAHRLAVRAIDARGATVLTASDDGTARVWSPETGTCRVVLRHPARVRGCALLQAEDALVAVTGCADGLVRVWEPDRGALLEAMHCASPVTALQRLEGERVGVACEDGRTWALSYARMPREPGVHIRGDELVVAGLASGKVDWAAVTERLRDEPNVRRVVVRAEEGSRLVEEARGALSPLEVVSLVDADGPSLWLEAR